MKKLLASTCERFDTGMDDDVMHHLEGILEQGAHT